MKALFINLICLSIGVVVLIPASAQTETDVRKKQYNLDKGIAIGGYDPVAYFTQHKAVPGQSAYRFAYQGVTYQFTSKANQALFQQDPAAYEPAYGGWCAYAMGATGEKVEVDPETFKVLNGTLYLFYNRFFNNTLPKWNKDETNLKRKADASWAKFLKSVKV